MYKAEYLRNFLIEVFKKTGCNQEDSKIIAEVLLLADLRGIDSHGLMRVKEYIELWKNGRINSKPDIKIIHETPSTALIDGDSGFGPVVGKFAMNIAIEKSKNAGTGWVSVRNSNHFGIAGYYSMMALENDMIGIAMTNANPLVAPTFSSEKMLGTNPIAFAIPANEEPPFVADFATNAIARGKLDLLVNKGEKVAFGLVQDKDGNSTEDPDILRKGGSLLTLGGDREHSSHKGYCMSSIVDILSAVLPGANFGPFVIPSLGFLQSDKKPVGKGIGHFFGAMRVDAFQEASVFKNNMDLWIRAFRNAKPSLEGQSVLVPGDIERELYNKNIISGIEIHHIVIDDLKKISNEFNIAFDIC